MKNRFIENELITLEDGRKVAIDRSVGVVMLCITADFEKVLVCKRGKKTSEYKESWNLPSGYLGWYETAKEAAIRETLEETGINLENYRVEELEHSTDPRENRQNVLFRFGCIVSPGIVNLEIPGPQDREEILEVKWINVNDIDSLGPWAFGQDITVKRLIEKIKLWK